MPFSDHAPQVTCSLLANPKRSVHRDWGVSVKLRSTWHFGDWVWTFLLTEWFSSMASVIWLGDGFSASALLDCDRWELGRSWNRRRSLRSIARQFLTLGELRPLCRWLELLLNGRAYTFFFPFCPRAGYNRYTLAELGRLSRRHSKGLWFWTFKTSVFGGVNQREAISAILSHPTAFPLCWWLCTTIKGLNIWHY